MGGLKFLSDNWGAITIIFVLGLAYLILKNGKDILRQINHNKEIQQREEERQRHMVEKRKREHAEEANRYRRN